MHDDLLADSLIEKGALESSRKNEAYKEFAKRLNEMGEERGVKAARRYLAQTDNICGFLARLHSSYFDGRFLAAMDYWLERKR